MKYLRGNRCASLNKVNFTVDSVGEIVKRIAVKLVPSMHITQKARKCQFVDLLSLEKLQSSEHLEHEWFEEVIIEAQEIQLGAVSVDSLHFIFFLTAFVQHLCAQRKRTFDIIRLSLLAFKICVFAGM